MTGKILKWSFQHHSMSFVTGRKTKLCRFPFFQPRTIYVDIIKGSNPELVDFVRFDMNSSSFHPRIFICSCHTKVVSEDGLIAWRFSTRQRTCGAIKTEKCITIRSIDGKIHDFRHKLTYSSDVSFATPSSFLVPRNSNNEFWSKNGKMEKKTYHLKYVEFNLELELAFPPRTGYFCLARSLSQNDAGIVVDSAAIELDDKQ